MKTSCILALSVFLLAACVPQENVQFGPPSFVSVESVVEGHETVVLRCVMSDSRVEKCGFLYGEKELDHKVECRLDGSSFETSLTGITPGVVYTWCAFAGAGESELRSRAGTFRLTADTDPIPIEDNAFKSYLTLHYDTNGDGQISYLEAARVTRINISPSNEYNLQSLQGIEYMPNLEEIDCHGEWYDVPDKSTPPDRSYYFIGPYRRNWDFWGPIGTLKYIDVSCNHNLKSLNIQNNSALGIEAGTIDLSNNLLLETLWIGMTWMQYPDISANTALETVGMSHLRGAFPDLSALTKVRTLLIECPQDEIVERIHLDVSNMPLLESLYTHNRIASLSDLSANPKLKTLLINSNGLTSLDLSGNLELEDLQCQGNLLQSLDVSGNPGLKSLVCSPMNDGEGINLLSTLFISHGQKISGVTFNRSAKFIPDDTRIEEVNPYPPDDEMWYSTASGGPLSSIKKNICPGLTIVSNTYDNGYGILKFNGTVEAFREWAMWETSDLTELYIPSSVTATTYSCFRECQQLRKVVFAPGLRILGDSSVHHNEALQEVILPDTVKSIEKDALSYCYSLEHIDLPPYLETLGQSSFLYCTALKSIVLPSTLKSIGIYAFEYDRLLESITCLAPAPPAGSKEMFHYTGDCPIYVPAESVETYRSAPYWSDYASRIRPIE